ncbi:aminotransferase class V-fold PLP-dependent enzyme [Spirosoma rhododendri]|uniref:Aminotransferase class V-fold PLP-dependent enzyme n=1 Tax=Spirosoma rhododendri TaxID=2728024 RepID=A0A7L5DTD0_9BACT|nr:aminotransferase class V-fold PLP-dependent enzyme [Spirosoma rhododendri]QJD78810.1 aminotransferase class V-fold PLP-dependent enzyme [Spirosoma rhododendri]
MTTRRSFFRQTAVAATSALTLPTFLPDSFANPLTRTDAGLKSAAEWAADEDFWAWVKSEYTVSPNLLNLNNGGVCPQPKVVQDAHIRFYQYANEAPSYYMWRILDQGREALREKLADLAGCSAEELAINRNATEGLNTVIFGLNLKPGDEVVLTKQDYPNMLNAWKQREKRDGIKLVYLNLDLPSENDDAITEQFVKAFTPRTKVVHVTHLVNWVGQVLPVRKIADEAHKRGIEVIADGAHSFALFDFKIPDLGADYYATSLHKWLCAPFGSGMLYIRQPKIKNVWALLSNTEPDGPDIRKFESLGTRSFASEMAIGTAVDFHNSIGSARKFARAHYLKNYWMERVKDIPGVKLHTSFKPEHAGAVALFSIDGMKPSEIDGQLMNQHKIHTVGIDWENIHGIRVTPHIYHTPKDLDRLVAAIDSIAGKRALAQKQKKS